MSDLRVNEIHRAFRLAHQIENDLVVDNGGPVDYLLARAQEEAIQSIANLILVNPTDSNHIRQLQNEVNRYRDMLRWLSEAVAAGFDAEKRLSEEDREDALAVLGLTENPDL